MSVVSPCCSTQVDEEAIARFRITKDDPRANPGKATGGWKAMRPGMKTTSFFSDAQVRASVTVTRLSFWLVTHAYVCVECADALHHRLPGRLVRPLS